nr:unnamed protein product [Callosobruchus chinensis]
MSFVRNLKEELAEHEDFDSSSGCDMSFELSHDEPFMCSPKPIRGARKLEFAACNNNNNETPLPKNPSLSPPYKRIRALRLFDSPLTPRTIIQKSTSNSLPRSRLFGDKPRAVPSAYQKREEKPAANVNPFTPDGMLLSKKRRRSVRSLMDSPELKPTILSLNDSDSSDVEVEQPTKRVALRESNISRYHQEFLELELIGKGQFGSVYKCVNRLDGCVYAVKKSTKPVAGSAFEKTALNEVYAHAVLGKHQHVVRYYSAWAEDNHMIIQNEYCNCGSLADKIAKEPLSQQELHTMLLHVAEGLRYIHSEGLVHMDIKPANIFIAREKKVHLNYDSHDDGFEELDENSLLEEELTYKIGDLGHVTSIQNPQVEEGDCRYLPAEILQDDYSHLPKADVFALGVTVIECLGGGPLPKNGEAWHTLRRGEVPPLRQKVSRDLLELVKLMIHPEPTKRPSPAQILQNRALSPDLGKSKAELTRELNAEKMRNEMLVKQLQEAAICIKTIASESVTKPSAVTKINSRLIDLEWKMIYVGSAESEEYDQVLESVFVGPIPEGKHMFVFQADPPNVSRIPENDAIGVTVVLLTCSYRNQEFIRVGYFINNEYSDLELRENLPSPPQFDKVMRNILASEPRVTRFKINWEETNAQEAVPVSEQNGGPSMSTSNATDSENAASSGSAAAPVDVPPFNENSNSWATMECS